MRSLSKALSLRRAIESILRSISEGGELEEGEEDGMEVGDSRLEVGGATEGKAENKEE